MLYQHFTDIEVEKNFEDFDELRVKFWSKRTEKGKSKQMCVSSQKIRMRKEEGATVAASHLPSLSWPLRFVYRPDRQRFMEFSKPSGKPH
jgi:hypothetical protein